MKSDKEKVTGPGDPRDAEFGRGSGAQVVKNLPPWYWLVQIVMIVVFVWLFSNLSNSQTNEEEVPVVTTTTLVPGGQDRLESVVPEGSEEISREYINNYETRVSWTKGLERCNQMVYRGVDSNFYPLGNVVCERIGNR